MNTSLRCYLFTGLIQMIIVLLMILLIWFEIVPTKSERDAQYIVNAGFQRERSRLFVNSTYALRYRSQTEKAAAISDLQITLPAFQQEQMLLATNHDRDVQNLVRKARPDYLFLIGAVQMLIAHPNTPVTQDQLVTVFSHDQSFFLVMDTLTTVLQQHAQQQTEQFLRTKGIAEGSCMIIALFWLFIDRDQEVPNPVNNTKRKMYKHATQPIPID
jgi:hypothetical protein